MHLKSEDDYSAYIDRLDDLASRARKEGGELAGRRHRSLAIGFFDLAGSTEAKLTQGNASAIGTALAFTRLVTTICEEHGGDVVKTMGDGAMVAFPDPVAAIQAALALRWATQEHLRESMRGGLTVGTPHRLDLDEQRYDLMGDVVDRAARIQSLAVKNQVLVDRALYSELQAEIPNRPSWLVDHEPRTAFAKGIGNVELFEFALQGRWALKKQLATPFQLLHEGRPSLAEKLALIRNAKSEIVEIGIGLTSFSNYFTGQKPDEFQEPIRRLVRGGVNLQCYAMDLTYEPGLAWLGQQGNDRYVAEAEIARDRIETEARHQRAESFRGATTLWEYARIPEFWCLGVDLADPLDGRMFFASYLPGIARSATPVMQLSASSNPDLYAKMLASVSLIRAASTQV